MARKHGVRVTGMSAACQEVLTAHSWPGNVRELQNVIERAVILCMDGHNLEPEHLGFVPLTQPVKGDGSTLPAATNITPFKAQEPATPDQILPLHEVEKQHILRALEICDGNRTQAAKHLDISIRTLRNKMHEYEGTTPGTEPAEAEGANG
jgi:DNA-binding NtrC family response regulator